MSDNRKLRVFLCHASQDKPVVRALYQRLLDEGWIDPWLDEENLLPGQDRGIELEKALESTDAALVCLSKQSLVTEGYIQREIKSVVDIAREKLESSIFIIPIRLDDCDIPRLLRSWQYVDFSSMPTREQEYDKLKRSLKTKFDFLTGNTDGGGSAHYVSRSETQSVDDLTTSIFGGYRFVKIPKGKFIMGSRVSNELAWDDEIPQRPYAIPYDYWISRFPITNEQFGEYAVSSGQPGFLIKDWRKKLNEPVVNISWHDAVAYTRWVNKVFSKEISKDLVFRLPTEAEWERASRGDVGREWPWGNENLDEFIKRERSDYFSDPNRIDGEYEYIYSKDFAEFFARAFNLDPLEVGNGPEKLSLEMTRKRIESFRNNLTLVDVGYFSPFTDSPYKVADMMGSILEWTQSLYMPYPYDALDGREKTDTPGERVIRGSFTSKIERFSVRSARRGRATPDKKEHILGFRIVVAPQIP